MAVPELADSRATARAKIVPRPRIGSGELGSAGLAVLLLTAVGLFVRVTVARESLFGDELSTYWIVATHGLHGVLSLIYGTASIKHAEITPPLYFVASWVTTQFGHAPILVRLPSLIAGTLTIPVVYLLGRRTIAGRGATPPGPDSDTAVAVSRGGAVAAAALVTFSPFMVYYSTEARAYGVMMLLVVGSTLALLVAIDTGRRRYWVLYGACACLAFWTHYTCVFVLGVQFLWALWAHPEARRPLLLATAGGVAGVLPWLPGLLNELGSPTLTILSDLSPFNAHAIGVALGHWAIGYPYAVWGLAQVPGRPALALLALAVLLVSGGLVVSRRPDARRRALRDPRPADPAPAARGPRLARLARRDDRLLLLVLLLLATPVLEAVISLVSTHVFGVRNLAASWPELALVFAALAVRAGPRVGGAAVALAVLAFGLGAERMVSGGYGRPDFQAAAAFVEQHHQPGDVVLDETNRYLSPGPLTPLDVALTHPVSTVRALAPDERSHPFTLRDPFVSLPDATRQAIRATAPGGRIILVGGSPTAPTLAANAGTPANTSFAGWHRVALHHYVDITVAVYARAPR